MTPDDQVFVCGLCIDKISPYLLRGQVGVSVTFDQALIGHLLLFYQFAPVFNFLLLVLFSLLTLLFVSAPPIFALYVV